MRPRRAQQGLTLLEILIAMLLLGLVALASGVVIRSVGLLGAARVSGTQFERPARLRTLAMEYVQAELEYLANRTYYELRDASACNPVGGLPPPIPPVRRVPATYIAGTEPRLPAVFAAADILITTDASVVGPFPSPDCRPRIITVNVYLNASDAPVLPGGSGGAAFLRGATARALQ